MRISKLICISVLCLVLSGCVTDDTKACVGWTLTQYGDCSGNQGGFYTLYNNEDGYLIVIDGGWEMNADYVRQTIESYGGTVDVWILTHAHNDHIDAFNSIFENPGSIQIKCIYDSPIDYEYYKSVAQEWDCIESLEKYISLTEGDERVHHLKRGDELELDGLSVSVFNAYDDFLLTLGNSDIPNDCSLVFRISGKEDSILFTGDCHNAFMADYLCSTFGDELKAEYVQASHHGNNSFPTYFYDLVEPSTVLFDATELLMTDPNHTASLLAEYFSDNGVIYYDYTACPNSFTFE